MGEVKCKNWSNQKLFVGLDLHKTKWVVTVRSRDLHLKTFTTLGSKEVFTKTLNNRFPGAQFKVAYEAGCFGYHITDYIRQSGSCRMKLSYFRLTEFQLLRAHL